MKDHSKAITGTLRPFQPVSDLSVSYMLQPSPTNLRLVFAISGSGLSRLLPHSLLDPAAHSKTGQRKDSLWTTTCFELFLRQQNDGKTDSWQKESYLELNVSAEGDWNLYRFSGYRQRAQTDSKVESGDQPPQISITHIGPQRLDVEILCCLSQNCPIATHEHGWFQPTCVLETKDGEKSYWSTAHPSAQPDFHAFHSGWLQT